MTNISAPRDNNRVPTLIGTSSADGITPVVVYADPTTHRLKVDLAAGSGTVTSVSVTTANGVSGSVATATTTPAITLTLGNITPTTVNKVTITAPATGSTLTIADGKTLTVSNTLTFTGTDSSSVAFGAGGTVLYSGGALGTPSSGTLTNATGLPIAGLVASTSTAIGVGSIELGNASDTTISRSSAGVIAVEGVVIPSISSTNTLTNKRVTARVVTTTQSATPTINTDNTDVASITGLAQAITSFTTNLSGTPVAGDTLIIEITDNGTARAISWGASFEASTVALPTTTVISTLLTVGFRWNSATSKWRCVAQS